MIIRGCVQMVKSIGKWFRKVILKHWWQRRMGGNRKSIGCDNLATNEYHFIRFGVSVRSGFFLFLFFFSNTNEVKTCRWSLRTVNCKYRNCVNSVSHICRNSGQTNQIISQPWAREDSNRTHRRFIPTAFLSDLLFNCRSFLRYHRHHRRLVSASDNYNQLPFFFFHHYLSVSIWQEENTKKEIWQPYPGSRHFEKSQQLQATSSSYSSFHKKVNKKKKKTSASSCSVSQTMMMGTAFFPSDILPVLDT